MGCRGIFLGPRCLAVVCKQRFAQEFTQRVGRRIHRVERGLRTTWMFVYMQSLCGGRVVGLGYLYRRRPPPFLHLETNRKCPLTECVLQAYALASPDLPVVLCSLRIAEIGLSRL